MTPSRRTPVTTDKRFRQAARLCDHGTPERWQHSGRALQLTDRAGILAARATEEHILDILAMKQLLDPNQVAAGLKFKADYHAASIAAQVTASYSSAVNARGLFRGEHERSDAQEEAYTRWRAAVRAMGLDVSPAVIATACHDETPRQRDLPALQNGLNKLIAWYKSAPPRHPSNTQPQT